MNIYFNLFANYFCLLGFSGFSYFDQIFSITIFDFELPRIDHIVILIAIRQVFLIQINRNRKDRPYFIVINFIAKLLFQKLLFLQHQLQNRRRMERINRKNLKLQENYDSTKKSIAFLFPCKLNDLVSCVLIKLVFANNGIMFLQNRTKLVLLGSRLDLVEELTVCWMHELGQKFTNIWLHVNVI